MLSLLFFVSVFVVISSISAVDICKSLFVYIFLFGSVFSSLTSLETSLSTPLSITRPCYLCCYVPDGLYPFKPRLRLGYIRRLSKKKKKKRQLHRYSVHLYSDKARCFNQSGRALYRNIIIINKLLECSSRFLSALQQNRAQSRLLYLFYDKESFNFPTHSPLFSKQTLFSEPTGVASACICTLIKHAKISQSQSLLEWFK